MQLFQEATALFSRVFLKYDVLEEDPIDLGNGKTLPSAQIHMIEAIGKKYGETATALASYFMVTKGAISHILEKLYNQDFITKNKKAGNRKEIILGLTEKGWKAFEIHEKNANLAIDRVTQIIDKYSEQDFVSFYKILNEYDQVLGNLINRQKFDGEQSIVQIKETGELE